MQDPRFTTVYNSDQVSSGILSFKNKPIYPIILLDNQFCQGGGYNNSLTRQQVDEYEPYNGSNLNDLKLSFKAYPYHHHSGPNINNNP
jgi:hypothetical protein